MSVRKLLYVLFLIISVSVFHGIAEENDNVFIRDVHKIISNKNLTLGLYVYDFESGQYYSVNGNKRFPMQSVYKFPIALSVLDLVDKGKYSLTAEIKVEKKDLYEHLWSPIREKYPNGGSIPLTEIISYAISLSDNSASDILMNMVGGAKKVQSYIKKNGLKNINIANTEFEMQSSWDIQFNNYATPYDMMKLIRLFEGQKLIKKDTHDFLWNVMQSTSTGSVKKLLPKDVLAIRKTGSSGVGENGITAALNDVGVMENKDGRRVGYVIFITDSKEKPDTNARVISEIALAIYSNFLMQSN